VYIGAAKLGEYDESIFCGGSDAVLAQLRVRPFSLILEKLKHRHNVTTKNQTYLDVLCCLNSSLASVFCLNRDYRRAVFLIYDTRWCPVSQ